MAAMDDFRTALLWREILKSSPSASFGAFPERMLNRHDGDALAQPGFVGSRFHTGRVMFLALNPASGGDGLSVGDQRQYERLTALRDSSHSEAPERLYDLMLYLREFMPTWSVWKYPSAILEALGLTIDDCAYLNLIKWRTTGHRYVGSVFLSGTGFGWLFPHSFFCSGSSTFAGRIDGAGESTPRGGRIASRARFGQRPRSGSTCAAHRGRRRR